ncbi:MAG TPA: tetratricopeptide repeat protein [Blastocatellia bacterium]|nr:tetratricopeptide repeat protein [Blastocatellia bacterium]
MTAARFFFAVCTLAGSAISATPQSGIRGQIFLPNGSPPGRPVRFILTTDNGIRTDILFTDSNGRIGMSAVNGPYTITIESDGQTYDTTSRSFDTSKDGNYITIHLRPLSPARPNPTGTVDAGDVDRNISAKAKHEYETALALLKDNKYEQAIEPLNRAIAIEKNYFQAHNDLAVIYMKLNKLDLAEATLRQAIKINGDVDLPYINLGILLNSQHRFKDSAQSLLKFVARHPDSAAVRTPLIEALIESQQWAEAEGQIKKALSDKSADVVDLKTKLGVVELRQNKFADAAAVLKDAVLAEPDNPVAQMTLGSALVQTGELDAAEKALLRAYQLKGSAMPGAQLLLGQVYFQKKDLEKALHAFETYLRDLPDAPNAAQVQQAIQQLREATKKP